MRKIFYGLAILFGILLIGSFSIQESYSEKVVMIRGMIFENGTTIFEDPWYRMENKIDIPIDNPGDIRIVYYDTDNTKIAETGFNYGPTCFSHIESCLDFMGFVLRIPDVGDFKKIVFLRDNQVLSEKIVSPNPPTVKILYPNGGETIQNFEKFTIKWEASDADGDKLWYSIRTSDDAGETWRSIAFDHLSNEIDYMFYNTISNSVLIDVIASDGISTTIDRSDNLISIIKKDTSNKYSIPYWFWFDALSWSEGKVSDESFVGDIQSLIDDKIIEIPETVKRETNEESFRVPNWMKQNIQWWQEGLVSDGDVIDGIQFLIEQGIIRV